MLHNDLSGKLDGCEEKKEERVSHLTVSLTSTSLKPFLPLNMHFIVLKE